MLATLSMLAQHAAALQAVHSKVLKDALQGLLSGVLKYAASVHSHACAVNAAHVCIWLMDILWTHFMCASQALHQCTRMQEVEIRGRLESGWQPPVSLDDDETAVANCLMRGIRIQ
jgi:hypothetical protein